MKAEILENLGESKYRVALLYDEARYNSVLSRQNNIITKLEQLLAEAETELSEAETELAEGGDKAEDAVTLLVAAQRLQGRFLSLQSAEENAGATLSTEQALTAQEASAESTRDGIEVTRDNASAEVAAITAERDALQDEYDILVGLRDTYQNECRLAGYEGEFCTLAIEYRDKATVKKSELDEKQRQLDEAAEELENLNGQLDQADSALSEIRRQLSDAETAAAQAQADLLVAQADFDAAFADYNASLSSTRGETIELNKDGYQGRVDLHQKEHTEAQAELRRLNEVHRLARMQRDQYKIDLKLARDKKKEIKKADTPPELECWTSFYNDQLEAGDEVEIILIPGEPTSCVIHEAGITNDYLAPHVWQSSAQSLFNLMILPGWQRHVYRFGTATIAGTPDGDLLPVEVTDHPSSAQGLRTARNDLPGSVQMDPVTGYQEGDQVLIDYQGEEPKIVGWYIEPGRPWTCIYCNSSGYYEYTAAPAVLKQAIDASLAGRLTARWRKDLGAWRTLTIDAGYYGDGSGYLTGFTNVDEYPGIFADYIPDEYSFSAMQALFEGESSSYGVYKWELSDSETGAIFMDVAFLLDAQLENGTRGKSTPPINRTGGGLPIEPLTEGPY